MSSTASLKCGNPACNTPEGSSTLLKCTRCRKEIYCSKECQAAQWSSHKNNCRRQNYIIRVQVAPDYIKNPAVTRVLSCPADAPFYFLHLALQTAFGWASTHSFDFAIPNPDYEEPTSITEVIQRRMALGSSGVNTDPSSPQGYLFRIIDPVEQTAFSGIDRMHEGIRTHPKTLQKKASSYKLYQLFEDTKYRDKDIIYTYDFGDNWEHYITIEGRTDATEDFICLDGTGHCIAEDAGGVRGWEEVKAAYCAGNPTHEQLEKRDWFEHIASNADPQGLAGDRVNAFDRDRVNRNLTNMLERFSSMADESSRRIASMYQKLLP
ncbi:MM3350-like domain-containing protein [Xylariaceae sp. FL0255]|nr:MM3350-like domain-containing protein [Xylariaceae sp. FL0255]